MATDLGRFIHLKKRFDFDASHWLPHLPRTHKCRRPHGHTYGVVIEVKGDIDDASGMLLDYADVAAAWAPIFDALDHRCLNGVGPATAAENDVDEQPVILKNPTTENLVHWILERLLKGPLAKYRIDVEVFESSTTSCRASSHHTPAGR